MCSPYVLQGLLQSLIHVDVTQKKKTFVHDYFNSIASLVQKLLGFVLRFEMQTPIRRKTGKRGTGMHVVYRIQGFIIGGE
jgi:hypothetical protein